MMIAEATVPLNQPRLVEQHLPLARVIATRLKRRYCWIDLDDLYSYSLLGLTMAARAWEPSRGVPFGAFAGSKAMYVAVDEMRRDRVLSRKSRHARQSPLHGPVAWASQELDPVDPRGREGLHRLEVRDQVSSVLQCLQPDDRHLLEMYYADDMTFEEIAQTIGLTRSAVCMRHKALLGRLKRLAQMRRGREGESI